jgi:glycosyltransferase involved in cell wall biosynthesis
MHSQQRLITWLTPDYFLNVDAKVVPALANDYRIDWILISTFGSQRTPDGLLSSTFKPREFRLQYRQRDPRVLRQYISLLSSIRSKGYDLLYTSFEGPPYFFPALRCLMDLDKVLYGIHNVHTPTGAVHERSMRLYQRYAFQIMNRFHVFSKYQLRTISNLVPHKRHYYAPFAPDDYGVSVAQAPQDRIRFTFFGYIRHYKRLDLLITAFKQLYSQGVHNIELVIAGSCDNWQPYEALIDNHPAIRARIGVIPNGDIADLISSSHYVVLPYQDGAQSAVLPLAYHYNRPVITSDIEPFRDAVVSGATGFMFRNLSLESLTQLLNDVVLKHESIYHSLTKSVELYVSQEYSLEKILARYRRILDEAAHTVSRNQSTLQHASLL